MRNTLDGSRPRLGRGPDRFTPLSPGDHRLVRLADRPGTLCKMLDRPGEWKRLVLSAVASKLLRDLPGDLPDLAWPGPSPEVMILVRPVAHQ